MPTSLRWTDIAIRLALTIIVGIVIGYNRSEHGKAAGMRTIVLVCLAASVAMIQVSLLLPTAGRSSDSFVMNDLMRLPLGILTGVGFIGGGAIMRRGDLVLGVTTAATLWLVTVIGLCLGGGQLVLGVAAAVLGLVALHALHWVEHHLSQEHRARLAIESDISGGPDEADLRAMLRGDGLTIVTGGIELAGDQRKLAFELRRLRRDSDAEPPSVLHRIASLPGVRRVDWQE